MSSVAKACFVVVFLYSMIHIHVIYFMYNFFVRNSEYPRIHMGSAPTNIDCLGLDDVSIKKDLTGNIVVNDRDNFSGRICHWQLC